MPTLNIWWKNVITHSVKPSVKLFAFVINNEYKDDIAKVAIDCGLKFIEEIKVAKPSNMNHFQRTAKVNNKCEQILVFANV